MGKLVLLPISIGGGLLAGLIGKNLFGVIWGLIDDQDPPKPEHRNVHVGKLLTDWLEERCDWPGAKDGPAPFLNQRGHRLSAKGAHDVITGIAGRGGLEDHVTAHVLRHSFATTLVGGGTDLVIAAELLGHARLETTRVYTRPTAADRSKVPVDE